MKKYIFIILILNSYIYASLDCCAEYGMVSEGGSHVEETNELRAEKCQYHDGDSNYGYGDCYDTWDSYVSDTCESPTVYRHVIFSNNEVEDNAWAYFKKTTTDKIQDSCTCEQEDEDFTPQIDISQWDLVATGSNCDKSDQDMPQGCYEADGQSYIIQTGKVSCCTVTKCYVKKANPYDCTQKGENWENHPNVDEAECLDYANQSEWDQASWESGSDYDDTCCLHAASVIDSDGDTIPDSVEKTNGTNPNNPDTDGDGKRDDVEGTADTDGDGAIDAIESAKIDTDGDGINDEVDFNPIYAITGTNANVNTSTSGSTTTRISNMADGSVITAVSTTNPDGSITTTSTITNPNGTTTTEIQTVNPDGTSTTQTSTANTDGTTTTQTTSTNPDGTTTTTGTTTNPDGNVTVNYNYDSSSTDTILKEIKVDMGDANNILQGIRSDIQTGSAQNHSDLGTLTDTVADASNQNHEDLTNLGSTLDEIKSNTDYLNELRDQADNTDNSLDNFSNALTDANTNYDSVLNAFTGLASSYTNAPPTFTGTGDHVFSTSVYGRTVSFDLGMFADLKPYFDILFALMLAYFNFRIYRWIFEFLVKIGAS